MPRKSKYVYPPRIRNIADRKQRLVEMRKFRAEAKKDRTLQRIRNLGRIPICPICQEPVFKKQRAKKQVVYCEADGRHMCHYHCWREWAQQTYAQTTCPACRHPYTNLNLKMHAIRFQRRGMLSYATIVATRLSADECGGWELEMKDPSNYDYDTFRICMNADDGHDIHKHFGDWALADFKHIHFTLSMMGLEGCDAQGNHAVRGEKFSDIQKLLDAAKRRKPALLHLGLPSPWLDTMYNSAYDTLYKNTGKMYELTMLASHRNRQRNIPPFNLYNYIVMGGRPDRALRTLPAKRVLRVVGTTIDDGGNPKKFVLSTRSGAPFAYDVNELTNQVILQADNATCSTVHGESMDDYTRFKIDLGRRDGSFRSSEKLYNFLLGKTPSRIADGAGPLSPWADGWHPLFPRTLVTLVMEDGVEKYYAQNDVADDLQDY